MGRIPDEDVQRVRDATDVVTLISESVVLKKKGRLHWGLCPFHNEKTASFKVDSATQLWHCFGCGEGGDAFGYLMRTEHLDFPDAVRVLADRGRIEIHEVGGDSEAKGRRDRLIMALDESAAFYNKTLLSDPTEQSAEARKYLRHRGFGSDVAKRFNLGYSPGYGKLVAHLEAKGFSAEEIIDANVGVKGDKGLRDRFYARVMFPIHDLRGRTVGFGGRVLGDAEPKYLNTQETPVFHKSRNLYALDIAKNEIVKSKQAVVVEGYTDVIAMHEAGIANVVATLGTALTRDHVKLLGRFSNRIVYLFDADEAGMRAAERAAEFIDMSVAPSAGRDPLELAVSVIPGGSDPADYVTSDGADAMREVLAEAVPLLRFVLNRRMDAQDLDSAEGRSRALAAAASVLASVKGSLMVQDYVNYVADRLHTDYTLVQSAVERAQPEFGGGSRSTRDEDTTTEEPRKHVRRDPHWVAQRAYVGLLASEPELRSTAREMLAQGLVPDPELSNLAKIIADAGDATGTDLVSVVTAADDSLQALLGEAVTDVPESDEEDVSGDLIRKLKEFELERQIIEEKARLRQLDDVKDKVAYDDVFRRVATLQKQLGRLRSGELDTGEEDVEQ